MAKKLKMGTTTCSLEELCFPVELIDNPRRTNSEYTKIVRGVISQKVPYFSNEELILMKETLTPTEFQTMLDENPKVKKIDSEIDLNYCSNVYELVPNSEIFPKVEEIFKTLGIAYKATYSHTNHARFYGDFVIEDPRFSYKMDGTNDEIKFIWNFQHSYNGLTKYKGIAGYHRLICSNGLTIPIKEMKRFNLSLEGKHTNSILHSLEQFQNILIDLVANFENVNKTIISRYEKLGGSFVANVEDRVREVLNVMGIVNKEKEKDVATMSVKEQAMYNKLIETNQEKVNSILDKINYEANHTTLGYNGKVNNWLIYNGINSYIFDDNRNIASPEVRREKDSKVLEYLLETV
jgi:hypothetical protein